MLAWRCPSTIGRGVVPVIVRPSVDSFARRSLPHVGKKVFKFGPSLADPYSALCVVFEPDR